MKKSMVIIGTGITGVTAAKAIREMDQESDVYLIGEEAYYPYNRIRLSKGIFSQIEENTILLQKKEWYEQNNIKILVKTKVTGLNPESQEVQLHDGQSIPYDKLLLANGAANKTPPIKNINKNDVFTLRNLEDALELKSRLADCNKIAIIGGGIQGLETAWILHQHDKKVIVCELLSRLMPYQMDEDASHILQRIIESYGIEIMLNAAVKEISGDKKVSGIIINDINEIQCDAVVYSIGIKPNMDLIAKTSIQTAQGILVNNKMETNLKNIYAAGDIAEFHDLLPGLWNIAIAQGRVAGYNMAGKETLYDHITPVTTLNAFGISLFSMGCIDETKATKILVEKDPNLQEYKKIYIQHNHIIGAIVIGNTTKSPILKTSIEKETDLEDVDLSTMSVDELIEKLKK